MDRTEMIETIRKIDSKLSVIRSRTRRLGDDMSHDKASEAMMMLMDLQSHLVSEQTDEEFAQELAEQVENPAQHENEE